MILQHLRDVCVNEEENLVFTTKDYNQLKFNGCSAFFNDYKKSHTEETVISQGIITYLKEQGKLPRKVSRNIAREIVESYDSMMKNLYLEKHDRLIEELHNCIIIGMKLK